MRVARAIMPLFVLTMSARALGASTEEIARLIDAADAGATLVVPPGVYEGHLTIKKAVTLDGDGRVTIDGGGEGTVLTLLAPGITIRGLTIRGSGSGVEREPAGVRAETGPVIIEDVRVEDALFGIDLRESPGSVIRRNVVRGKHLEPGRRGDGIRLWWSHGCTVEENDVAGSRDMVFWYSEDLTIARNTVRDSRYGLHFMYSHNTHVSENVLSNNSVGVYLMYSNSITLERNRLLNNRGASGYGVGLKDCDDIVVTSNAILANRVGLYVDNSPSSADSTGVISRNYIAFNETGLLATPITHANAISENAFVENEEQAASHGRGDLSRNDFAVNGRGNFWSDYAGFDHDGDAIGEVAYEPRSLFFHLLASEPNLRLFIHSPAQQAIEFTARALPELQPTPILTDPSPLTALPTTGAPIGMSSKGSRAMGALGAALAGVSALVVLSLGRAPRLAPTGHPERATGGREAAS
ncbi:MAG: nitrous oxide reductase family maturation protein NosD [Phycisphaerales bacterium]